MKIAIIISMMIISIYFTYSQFIYKKLNNGNVIINKSVLESKNTKCFIYKYNSNVNLFREIWLENKKWRGSNENKSNLYNIRFYPQNINDKIELLSIDIKYLGYGKSNSIFFIETDDNAITHKKEIICKLRINESVINIKLIRVNE